MDGGAKIGEREEENFVAVARRMPKIVGISFIKMQ